MWQLFRLDEILFNLMKKNETIIQLEDSKITKFNGYIKNHRAKHRVPQRQDLQYNYY